MRDVSSLLFTLQLSELSAGPVTSEHLENDLNVILMLRVKALTECTGLLLLGSLVAFAGSDVFYNLITGEVLLAGKKVAANTSIAKVKVMLIKKVSD